jgi:keratan sulfate 6-sulfotransferase 1
MTGRLMLLKISTVVTCVIVIYFSSQLTYISSSAGDEKSSPLKIILFAYYRTGSTLAGELFNGNPSAFYWYEPLAAVTEKWGWVHDKIPPRNFYHFDNRTDKQLTDDIRRTLIQPLHNIFSCDFDSFDEDVLQHRFMTANYLINSSFSMQPFKLCIGNNRNCTRQQLEICRSLLTDKCRNSKLLVVKVIRLHMSIVEDLLNNDPGIHVIHLIRDPRGMLESWWKSTPIKRRRHQLAESVLDAVLVCQRILTDTIVRRQLELKYPNRFQLVRYEDLATKPMEVVNNIYSKFLGLSVPTTVVRRLSEMINSSISDGASGTRRKNSTETAMKWRQTMDSGLRKNVTEICLPLLRELGYET